MATLLDPGFDAAGACRAAVGRRRAASRADSRLGASGRRVRRVPRAGGRRARVHPGCDRARRRRRVVGRVRLSLESGMATSPTSRSTTSRRSSARSPTSSTEVRRTSLWVAGVTGTNGKTSCSHWIAQCLDACGTACRHHRHARQRPRRRAADASAHTTPDAALVHATLAADARRGRARRRDGGLVARASIRDASTASSSTSRCSPI